MTARARQAAFGREEPGVEHDIASRVVLGECDAVADAVKAGKQRYPAVKTVGKTSVRGRAVLEGVHEEAELLLCALGCEAEYLKHLGLQLAVVDTD